MTPKISLFAAITEYTFLMDCYLDLIGYFNITGSQKDLRNASHNLYLTWCSITATCFKRYVLMPTVSPDTYVKLLLIHLEATTGYQS